MNWTLNKETAVKYLAAHLNEAEKKSVKEISFENGPYKNLPPNCFSFLVDDKRIVSIDKTEGTIMYDSYL